MIEGSACIRHMLLQNHTMVEHSLPFSASLEINEHGVVGGSAVLGTRRASISANGFKSCQLLSTGVRTSYVSCVSSCGTGDCSLTAHSFDQRSNTHPLVLEAATLVALHFLLVLTCGSRSHTHLCISIYHCHAHGDCKARTENFVCLRLLGGTSSFSRGSRSSAGRVIGSRRSRTLASVFLE